MTLLCFCLPYIFATDDSIVMKITEMYILLGGSEFLCAHSSTISNLLGLVVGKISARGMFYTTLVTEALLRKFSDGAVLLRHAGIFETMLKSCACNVRHQKHHESDRVVLQYLTSLSRGLLVSPHMLDDYFPITVGGNVDAFHPHELVCSHCVPTLALCPYPLLR